MTHVLRTGLVIGALMFATSAAVVALRPTIRVADHSPKLDLESIIPRQFSTWRIDESIPMILPSPDVQEALNKIYNQTLARTYISENGMRVMLSIAYGGDQSDTIKIHRPEGCYTGQGFDILRSTSSALSTPFGEIQVNNLVARNGHRNEPITYWIVIGNQIALTDFEIKKVKLRYALRGEIPDGMLVRVSSISTDEREAFQIHEHFAGSLAQAMSKNLRERIVGVR